MISPSKYEGMLAVVHQALRERRRVTAEEAIELEVAPQTLLSLYHQVFVRVLKSELRGFSNHVRQDIVRRVHQGGESLLQIAKEYPFGTYKFALLYTEAAMGRDFQLSSMLFNPEVIADERIRADLLAMIAEDVNSSHEVELVKELVGKEYESLLVSLLRKRKMCFETEVELRSKGKPKTPDILFVIPMAMGLTEAEQRRRKDRSPCAVINWIDSKAMFADTALVEEQMEQFRAYNNRYGRGLVIYWHGFVEDVANIVTDDMVLFRASFPSHWIFPTGEVADGRTPAFDSVSPAL